MFEDIIFEEEQDEINEELVALEDAMTGEIDFPKEVILYPSREILFPGIIMPIMLESEEEVEIAKLARKNKQLIGITAFRKKKTNGNYGMRDFYKVGTLAQIIKVYNGPSDGENFMVVKSLDTSFKITKRVSGKVSKIFGKKYFFVKITPLEYKAIETDVEEEAFEKSIKQFAQRLILLSEKSERKAILALRNIKDIKFLINVVASNIEAPEKEKQEILEEEDLKKRSIKLLKSLMREVEKLSLRQEIQSQVKNEMETHQREHILQEEMKVIQKELGYDNTTNLELEELRQKASKKKWNANVQETFEKQLKRLERIPPMSPDYTHQVTYIQTLTELPWNEYSKDNFDIPKAKKILDNEHFGLEEIKDRILEHLAILKLKGDLKAPILCLYGPPGVGKTSLGRSIAHALNRKYVNISLGGLHDEAEIRGHRKTYIGAMPGRIIQSLKKVKTSNPVFVLDEIDKIGNDFRGDPSAALLEVLDPEQNSEFYDNYLELEYDLSKILFIATANSLSEIKPALLDRMELIHVSGYIQEEKIKIAQKHLVNRQLKKHGIKSNQLNFSKEVLDYIISDYTSESGVRTLDKHIATIIRKTARKIVSKEPYHSVLTKEDVTEYLGIPRNSNETIEGNQYAGVVTGLAWTSAGGKILFVEASISKGNGKLNLTGNLGQVMKESAIIALEYLRAHAQDLDLSAPLFSKYNMHLHVPEGAIPKDGPSAGITMTVAMASALTQRKVKNKVAMTGEMTLRGKVLPVGGIKEKILAAKRAGIITIILSKENKKDIDKIKKIYIKGLKFHFVEHISEVLSIALLKQTVKNPLKFEV